MIVDTNELKPGFYAVGQHGGFYEVELPISTKLTKTVDLKTGEVHYPTLADRIRHMTDDELVTLFCNAIYPECQICCAYDETCDGWEDECEQNMLAYLRREANE